MFRLREERRGEESDHNSLGVISQPKLHLLFDLPTSASWSRHYDDLLGQRPVCLIHKTQQNTFINNNWVFTSVFRSQDLVNIPNIFIIFLPLNRLPWLLSRLWLTKNIKCAQGQGWQLLILWQSLWRFWANSCQECSPHYGFLQAENCYKRADCELHIHYFAWLAAASRELRYKIKTLIIFHC